MIENKKEIKNIVKQNYEFNEWKNIFYKSIKDLLFVNSE